MEDRQGVLADRDRIVVQATWLDVDITGDGRDPLGVEMEFDAALQLLLVEHEVVPAEARAMHVVGVADVAERLREVAE